MSVSNGVELTGLGDKSMGTSGGIDEKRGEEEKREEEDADRLLHPVEKGCFGGKFDW